MAWHWICSKSLSFMKIVIALFRFYWTMFPRIQLMTIQHSFVLWLGADQAPCHYLNQWWLRVSKHIFITRPQWVVILFYIRIPLDKLFILLQTCFYTLLMAVIDIATGELVILNGPCVLICSPNHMWQWNGMPTKWLSSENYIYWDIHGILQLLLTQLSS